MRTMNTVTKSGLGLAALTLSVSALGAGDVDTSEWSCESCLFPAGVNLLVDLGALSVAEDSARFGDFTGLEDSGGYAVADVLARWWSQSGSYWELEGLRLGLDSRTLRLEGGKQGLYKFDAYYDSIPRRIFDDARTPFDSVAGAELGLPAGWIYAGSTGQMSALASSLVNVPIEYDREIIGLGFTLSPFSNWSFDASFRQDVRDGTDRSWGSFLTQAVEFAQPVDYTTDEFSIGATYAAKQWSASLEYFGSQFTNEYAALSWANPYLPITPGSDTGAKAMAPDNQFHQLSVSGNYRFDLWDTLLAARISMGEIEQNEAFLPYTSNSQIVTDPLPRSDLAGLVDTTNVNLRVNASPWRGVRLSAEYRMDDRDNKTPVDVFQTVRTDAILGNDLLANQPYSFQRDDLKLKGVFRIDQLGSFQLGYDLSTIERDLQERTETDTDRLWATLQVRPNSRLDGSFTLSREERDGNEYQDLALPYPQNPLMRKYNMADRTRDSARLFLSFAATDALNLGLTAEGAQDDYSQTLLGLTESNYSNLAVDASLALPGNTAVYLLGGRENIDSSQVGGGTAAFTSWQGSSRDTFDTAVLGFTVKELAQKVDLKLDYTYVKSSGRQDVLSSGSDPYPDLRTKLSMIKLYVDYRWRPTMTFRGGYWYEKYDTSNWSLQDVQPSTVPNLLSLGSQPYDYQQDVFWLSFKYEFGLQQTVDAD